MREIKFRAWVQNDKAMIMHREVIERAHLQYRDSLNASDIVMQYTGLKDRTGKEIYEGDILKVNDAYQDYSIVEYSAPEFTLFDNKDASMALNWEDWEKSEVVGNIYEDKHLLKEK